PRDARRHVEPPQGVLVRDLPLGLLRSFQEPLGKLVRDARVRQSGQGPRLPPAARSRPHGMNAEVLSIGNEVLSGRTVDTNFALLARLLEESGARVIAHQTLPDEPEAIASALHAALARADVVVATGGLGPTPDDLTIEAVASALGLPVALDQSVLESIRARWATFSRRPMPENNRRQAMLPAGATAWTNPVGSAPGI